VVISSSITLGITVDDVSSVSLSGASWTVISCTVLVVAMDDVDTSASSECIMVVVRDGSALGVGTAVLLRVDTVVNGSVVDDCCSVCVVDGGNSVVMAIIGKATSANDVSFCVPLSVNEFKQKHKRHMQRDTRGRTHQPTWPFDCKSVTDRRELGVVERVYVTARIRSFRIHTPLRQLIALCHACLTLVHVCKHARILCVHLPHTVPRQRCVASPV
jgi:hypothetical protein